MPRVVPSQIVYRIDKSFHGLQTDPQFLVRCSGTGPAVVVVAELLRHLSDSHLAHVPADDYALFVAARELIAEFIEACRHSTPRDRSVSGGPTLDRTPALDGRNPLEVIRAVLATCSDEAPSQSVKLLSFLGDPLASTIRLDMSTALSALGNGEFKAASVMAGSVVEALLLWALKRKTPTDLDAALTAWRSDAQALGMKRQPPSALPTEWGRWTLETMIEVARRVAPVPIVSPATAGAANSARHFRNLIHPERADATPPTMGTAQIAVGAMQRVAEELEGLVSAGSL